MRLRSLTPSTLVASALLTVALAGCGKDETAPVISLTGADLITIEFGDTFVDPGATVSDDKDEEVEVVVTGSVDTQALGDYTLTYEAVDEAGNVATILTRTVSVVDTTPPVITLTGDATETVLEGEDFEDLGATVTDAADPTVSVEVSGEVDTSRDGTYILTYSATDASGNVATPVERTVTVVFDGQLFVVTEGADLVLMGMDVDGTIAERSRTSFDGVADYNPNHLTFDVVQHPTSGELYASSFNDCPGEDLGDEGCWGNGRIDRYSYDVNTITHEGIAYLAQPPLRARRVVYDEGTATLTLPILNQGTTPLAVTSVVATNETEPDSVTSTCDGTELQPGDECEVVFSAIEPEDLAEYLLTADWGTVQGSVEWSERYGGFLPDGIGIEWETAPAAPRCQDDDFGMPLNHGACAITALAFPDDGARLFANEDNDDHGLVFDSNDDGSLTFVSESLARFRIQGLATSPLGDVVYNGLNVFEVSDEGDISSVVTGSGGNATDLMTFDGTDYLVTTVDNSTLQVLDLVDPLAPQSVASLLPSLGGARFQAHSQDGARFVVVDKGGIVSVSFDGETLTEQASAEITITSDACSDCNYEVITRKVDLTADGAFAIAGTFVVRWDDEALSAFPDQGLVSTFSVDPVSGALTELDALTLPNKVRHIVLVEPQ